MFAMIFGKYNPNIASKCRLASLLMQVGNLGANVKRILVYSHDTFGLGNIRRMLEIAKHLVHQDPEVSVLILSGSPMLHAFRIPPRIDYIKLPCLTRSLQGEYGVKFLDLSYEQAIRLRSNLIMSAMLDFDPHLILVDKKPFGVSNELAAALDLLQRRGHRPKLVLLLRDILDTPEVTMQTWRKNGYFPAIDAYYDEVLVVGSREIFDLTTEYQFPATCQAKVRFCGYIRRSQGLKSIQEIRRDLRIGDERMVLLTAGGGEDGYHLLTTYLQALALNNQAVAFKTLLVCGPEMADSQRRQILSLAANLPSVIVKEFVADMASYMGAADLVVAMGGYNTICEILTLRKRAIIVPRVRPVQEQWIRAERMQRLGLLTAIHPDELTAKGLLNAVHNELDCENVVARGLYQLDLDGLPRICQSLNALLSSDIGAREVARPTLQWSLA
jgi:predicted glycosyltransferase